MQYHQTLSFGVGSAMEVYLPLVLALCASVRPFQDLHRIELPLHHYHPVCKVCHNIDGVPYTLVHKYIYLLRC